LLSKAFGVFHHGVQMSEYFTKINWVRDINENYVDNKYSRGHEWIFDGGVTV
jgi:hypothetical protein